jgi:hypothetical protein
MPPDAAALSTPSNLPVILQRGFTAAQPSLEVMERNWGKYARSHMGEWSGFFLAAATAHAARAQLSERDLALDLVAICDRETCGQNILGDGGHGHGGMQIDDRFHKPWLQANANGLDPASNILKGCEIYVDGLVYFRRLNAQKGLGLSEAEIRMAALAAYNGGVGAVAKQLLIGRRSGDLATSGKDYSSNTFEVRRVRYLTAVQKAEAELAVAP